MCTAPLITLCSPEQAKTPSSIALGSFDGLHQGHRLVIASVVKDAPGIPTVVSFWPHPREVLYAESRLRLNLPSEKASLLSPLGIEQLVLVPFDHSLASQSAEAFVKGMLFSTLKAKRIAVGANFRFGRNREGDVFTLKKLCAASGVEIEILPIYEDDSGRISSSRIRLALSQGNLELAKTLMGRPYRFRGQVIHGKGLGKKLGWPTANLSIDGRKFLPSLGVYAALAFLNDSKSAMPAIMNLGPQPTVNPKSPSAVEVHLLNQNLELEQAELVIEPIKKIRDQQRFQSLAELSDQISKDAVLAEKILRSIV